MRTDFTTGPFCFLISTVTDLALNLRLYFTLNFLPAFTLLGADTLLIGGANWVINALSPPGVGFVASGFLANTWKGETVHGVRFEISSDTACVFGVLQYGLGGLIPLGHEPRVRVGVWLP